MSQSYQSSGPGRRVRANRARRARRHRTLHVESLESRHLLAAVPWTTLQVPSEGLLGESVTVRVSFSNNSPADTGYGPFVDLILPATGVDGAGAELDDGITFSSARCAGQSIAATATTFDEAGNASHPLARDSSGHPVIVTGTPGDQLVVLPLPFGSYAPGQLAAELEATVLISPLADANVPLAIQARGGFRDGNDMLDNPATDPSILESPLHSGSVTPVVYRVTKTYSGPEDETATGPNYPRQYTVTAHVADGVTLDLLALTDVLPDNLQFVSVDATLVHGVPTAADAIATPSTSEPGGTLTRRFATVTGTSDPADASMTFTFYVPRTGASGPDILDPATGHAVDSSNQARSTAHWNPVDPRDPATPVSVEGDDPGHTLHNRSLAVQGSWTLVTDVGAVGLSPGDTVEYQLTFQISDYFSFGDLVVTDVLSDGQRLDAGFAPTFAITDREGTWTGSFTESGGSPDLVVDLSQIGDDLDPATDGSTRLVFNVSQALVNAGAPDGILQGGCSVAPDSVPATGTLVFRATIQERFSDTYAPRTPNISEGDQVFNHATIAGSVRDNSDLAITLGAQQDTSANTLTMVIGTLAKTVYAVNGSTALTLPVRVAPGDAVTYRFTYALPMTDVNSLSLVDYLPMPIFDATSLTTFDPTVNADVPAPGTLKHGPADTFRARTGLSPSLSTSATSNSFTIAYADFDDPASQPSTLDLLATFVVSATPQADQSLWTNQIRASQQSTNASDVVMDGFVQVMVTRPVLSVTKGVVATDSAQGMFLPGTAGPVTFSAPGGATPRFSGTIHSTNLAATPIDSNLAGVDAADRVTFAIVIENTGAGLHGAFDIRVRDTLPADFAVPAGGLQLSVTDGAGRAIPYIDLGGGLFGSGIELIDSGASGALAASDPTSGRNIAVLTYDLEAQVSVTASSVLPSTATLFNYAGAEGGADHTPTDQTDSATVTIAGPSAAKSTPDTRAAIGKIVTFHVTITLPECTTPALTVVETLDAGLAYVDLVGITTSDPANVSWSLPVTPSVATGGQAITFDLGTVVNRDQDNDVAETITIAYRAVVLNVLANQQGTDLSNSALISWTGGSLPAVSSSRIAVVEPNVAMTMSRTVGGGGTVGDAGDSVQYLITIRNTSGVTAYDVTFSDALPRRDGVSSLIVSPSFTVVDSIGAVTAASFELVGDDTSGWSLQTVPGVSFDMVSNASRRIRIWIDGTLALAVRPNESITNTAQVRFTSIDGDPGAISPHNADSTERTGADGPGTGLNNYATNVSATLTTFPFTPVHSLVTTSEASTSGNTVAIGEIMRYRLTSRLAESTAPLYQLFYSLPAGLRMLHDGTAMVALVSNGGGITSSTLSGAGLAVTGNESTLATITPTFVLPSTAITPATFGSGTAPTFHLGTLINYDDDDDQEFVVLEFNVLVENYAANRSGRVLNTRGRAQLSGIVTGSYSSYVGVTVREPAIADLTKTADPTKGDAGDVISYRVTYSNPAEANVTTAFDLQLTDLIPAGLALDIGSITITASGATGLVNNSAGNTVAVAVASLEPGGAVQIDYQAELLSFVQPEQTLTNTARLTYTSLPGHGTAPNSTGSTVPGAAGSSTGERTGSGGTLNNYAGTGTASVTVTQPEFSKVVLSTNQPFTTGNHVVIGEQVVYQLTIMIVEGITYGMSVLDQFPVGLALVSLDSITVSPALSTTAPGGFAGALAGATVAPGGHAFVIDLQTITNSDTDNDTIESIRVDFTAVVVNVDSNQDGVELVNSATVFYSTGDVTTVAPPMTVVESVLEIRQTASSTAGDAGEPAITFSVTMSHDAASTVEAFDVIVEDSIPAGFDYVSGSLEFVSGARPDLFVESGGTITVAYAFFPPGSTCSFTFAAALNDSTSPGQVLTNTALVRYTTLPGDATTPMSPYNAWSTERTGDTADPGGPTNDNRAAASVEVEVRAHGVSGYVFVDWANDGVRDPGDAGVPGVTLTLTGTDNLGYPVNRTTTTNPGGDYAFANLRPGAYRIEETQPAGYLDGRDMVGTQGGTSADDRIDFSIPLGVLTEGTENNFGELLPARVSGGVYQDLNNDGMWQPGEPGIQGTTVHLTGTDDRGTSVDRTLVTDVSGGFSFDDLRPGSYTLRESQPDGFLDGRDALGAQGGTLGNDVVAGFTLMSGQDGAGNLFGELPPASLAGAVYEDLNENATIDLNEHGVGHVTVTLTGTDDLGHTVQRTTSTGVDGTFVFADLRPGVYALAETQPAEPYYFDGLDTIGSLGGLLGNDEITGIAVAPGQDGTGYLFGELPPADPVGYVFVDVNDNGVRDPGEPPIPGVVITVTGVNDLGQSVALTATTDSNGRYQFRYLRAGTYDITETQPAHYTDGQEQNGTPPATVGNDVFTGLTLTWGQFAGDYNFGELASGSLSGHVYVDSNHNGQFDALEIVIPGVLITLSGRDLGGNPVLLTTTTDENGSYLFDSLLPGTYRIAESQPAAYADGADRVGSLGGRLQPDAVDEIFMTPNGVGINYDFGENGIALTSITKQWFLARGT